MRETAAAILWIMLVAMCAAMLVGCMVVRADAVHVHQAVVGRHVEEAR